MSPESIIIKINEGTADVFFDNVKLPGEKQNHACNKSLWGQIQA